MKIIIRSYQLFLSRSIRLIFGPGCRFTPTCSEYAYRSISKFGMFHGTIMAYKRLLRCHPFGGSGYDPI